MNITFDQFNKIINYIDNQRQFANGFRTILKEYNKDEFIDPYSFFDAEGEQLLVDLLETIFLDEEHWIKYYIYDLDCGHKWQKGMITSEDGKDICLGDTWHLWNFLITKISEDI